jgi:alcohol dehydrogenase class IV
MATFAPFEHTNPATRIVAGPGSLARLPELMDAIGASRALVVCGRTVSEGPQLAAVRDVLGERIADVFVGVSAHAGLEGLRGGVAVLEESQADCLISIGGGATIDSTKCIALLAACDAPLEEYRVRKALGLNAPRRAVPTTLPHIAIPTTAGSSSEIMPWAGIRDEVTREKMLFRDAALVPRVAVLDPRMVAPTGMTLTATSAVTSLARSIETLYSTARQPISEALALKSLELMVSALPRVMADPNDLDARAATQVAATISGIAADNSMVSLVHAVGHTVGGRIALQHGVAHGILLPPAMRRYLPTTGPLQRRIAEVLSVADAGASDDALGMRVVETVAELLAALPTPRSLSEVGVEADQLADFAAVTVRDPMFSFVPVATSEEEVLGLLHEVLTA